MGTVREIRPPRFVMRQDKEMDDLCNRLSFTLWARRGLSSAFTRQLERDFSERIVYDGGWGRSLKLRSHCRLKAGLRQPVRQAIRAVFHTSSFVLSYASKRDSKCELLRESETANIPVLVL